MTWEPSFGWKSTPPLFTVWLKTAHDVNHRAKRSWRDSMQEVKRQAIRVSSFRHACATLSLTPCFPRRGTPPVLEQSIYRHGAEITLSAHRDNPFHIICLCTIFIKCHLGFFFLIFQGEHPNLYPWSVYYRTIGLLMLPIPCQKGKRDPGDGGETFSHYPGGV
jgi:hypothetical protein